VTAEGAADAAPLAQALAVGGTMGAGALQGKTYRVEAILLVDGEGEPYVLASASLREIDGRVRYILPPQTIEVNLKFGT